MEINTIAATIGAVSAGVSVGVTILTIYKDFRKNKVDTAGALTKSAIELATHRSDEYDDCRDRLVAAYKKIDTMVDEQEALRKFLFRARQRLRELGEDTGPFYPVSPE